MTHLREAMELYGLMLFLHRETKSDGLLADARLQLNVGARDHVGPRLRLHVVPSSTNPEFNATERLHAIWRAVLELFDYDTPQPRLSDQYYTIRSVILSLFGVDEACVAHAAAHVTLNLALEQELLELMDTFPAAALRKLEVVAPHTPMAQGNESRTRLVFAKAYAGMEFKAAGGEETMERAESWIMAPAAIKTLTIAIPPQWSTADAMAFADLLNQGRIERLELKIMSARALRHALEIFAHVNTVVDVSLMIAIDADWYLFSESLDNAPTPHTQAPSSSVGRLRIFVGAASSMAIIVETMMEALERAPQTTRAAINQCRELEFHTLVNEARIDDLPKLSQLLDVIGHHMRVIQTRSYSSSEYFNDETYAQSPDAFRLQPILTACPKLQLLSVQGALFDDISELFEKRITTLAALQVQWAPVDSVLALAKALSVAGSPIARHLVEFSTRLATDKVIDAFADALSTNTRIRFLRLGFRPRADAVAQRLRSHHNDVVTPGGSAFVDALDNVQLDGTLGSVRRDSGVLDAIAECVGPTVHRQIQFR